MSSVLNKFRLKFWKRTCGNAFSTWRSGGFKVVTITTEEVVQETNLVIENHNAVVQKRKDVNAVKSEKRLAKSNLANIWKTWVTVIKYYKLIRMKNERKDNEIESMRIRNAVRRWKGRKDATKIARTRVKRLKILYKQM